MDRKIDKLISSRPALRTLPNNIITKRNKEEFNKTFIDEPNKCKKLEKNIKPAQKTTLLNKISGRYMIDSEENHLEKKIFEDGSQKEYIRYLISEEWRYILRRNFLDRSPFNVKTRFVIVDRLLKFQQHLNIPENEYYLAIKIMDSTIKICEDPREGNLLALTSLWIVHKFSNNSVLVPVSEIFLLSDETFSIKDILAMEQKILSAMKFKILLPEPSIFLEHYLRKVKLNENKVVYFCCFFVCDCLSMFPKFSCVEPSFIAAVSLYTALTVLKENICQFLCLMKNLYTEELLRSSSQDCLKKIGWIRNAEDHREPFVKYSSLRRLNVSKYFEKCDEVFHKVNL